mmetsp:Transcript_59317/g.171391  ORF Transcript_59317/g.171391 Transcript_59317/m.171391 type:complete len:114 (+) Transcript_59317:977-1318(+)
MPRAIEVVAPVACDTKWPKVRRDTALTMPAQIANVQPNINTHHAGRLKATITASARLCMSESKLFDLHITFAWALEESQLSILAEFDPVLNAPLEAGARKTSSSDGIFTSGEN